LSGRLFGIIKFILGVCLLPFVWSASLSFFNESSLIEKPLQDYFWAGVITFLVIYLFIYEPAIIYRKGYRLMEIVFSFFAPLVKVAPYVLPIYALLVFAGYLLGAQVFKTPGLINYFMFLFAFSIALHIVFSAKAVRSKQEDFLKANYIFGFSLIYIIDLLLLAFCLNIIFKEFSFLNFSNNAFQLAKEKFYIIFKQLFLIK
jgi:hypothetical protein